jgi:hypothetical protein
LELKLLDFLEEHQGSLDHDTTFQLLDGHGHAEVRGGGEGRGQVFTAQRHTCATQIFFHRSKFRILIIGFVFRLLDFTIGAVHLIHFCFFALLSH